MRLENGAGSVCVLPGNRRKKYAARVTVGWKDGKQVRKYIGYYKTPSEAMLALAEYANGGLNIDFSKITVEETFDMWLEHIKKKHLSDSVYRTHNMTKTRLGRLGNRKLKDVKALTLQQWLDEQDVKPGTKKLLRGTLNQMYKYAVSNDLIQKNYATSLEINEKVEQTGAVFTGNEIKLLWNHQNDETARQLLIMIYTGMRIGELLAVKREDINFEEKYIIGGSKTEAGKDRIIPLHDEIIPLIIDQLGNNQYLAQSIRGNQPMAYGTVLGKANDLFQKYNMSHKIHDCRKTAVSLMHSAGIQLEIIRIIVGHAGEGVTERVYLKKNPSELVKEINKIKVEKA